MEPENTPLGKGETSTNQPFLGSMLVFGGCNRLPVAGFRGDGTDRGILICEGAAFMWNKAMPTTKTEMFGIVIFRWVQKQGKYILLIY